MKGLVGSALTEALFITNPNGVLFQTLKRPENQWILGYDGFSRAFQVQVYGEETVAAAEAA